MAKTSKKTARKAREASPRSVLLSYLKQREYQVRYMAARHADGNNNDGATWYKRQLHAEILPAGWKVRALGETKKLAFTVRDTDNGDDYSVTVPLRGRIKIERVAA